MDSLTTNTPLLLKIASILTIVVIMIVALMEKRRIPKKASTPANFRVRWSSSPEDYQLRGHHWPLAAGALYAMHFDEPWDAVAFCNDPAWAKDVLRRDWGITRRDLLLLQIYDLLIRGQRSVYGPMIAHYAGISERSYRQKIEDIDADTSVNEGERASQLYMLRFIRQNEEKIQSVDFSAWDLLRVILLCRIGCGAGYITEEEAADFMLLPCLQLQDTYASWGDCSDQWARARGFWQGGPEPTSRRHTGRFQSMMGVLQSDPLSPWGLVPWNLELPRPKWLFVHALFDAGLIVPMEEHERDHVGGWARILDNALREILNMEEDEDDMEPEEE